MTHPVSLPVKRGVADGGLKSEHILLYRVCKYFMKNMNEKYQSPLTNFYPLKIIECFFWYDSCFKKNKSRSDYATKRQRLYCA